MNHKYLGVIPARGGSKRLPRKNLSLINGKPLIYWSIQAAKESKLLDDFIVTTEDDEIAKISEKYKAKVSIRPLNLSEDNVSIKHVLKYIATLYPEYDYLVLLQPTNPIRVNNLIDRCIEKVERGEVDSLATGFLSKHYEWTAKGHDPLGPLSEKEGWFYNDGCVEIHNRDILLDDKSIGNKVIKYIVDDIHHEDIDNYWDLIKTESVMRILENINESLF